MKRTTVSGLRAFRLTLRHGKTDRYNLGAVEYVVERAGDPLCAVNAIDQYLRRYPHAYGASTPFFIDHYSRRLKRYVYTSKRHLAEVMKDNAELIGMDSRYISGQSLRVGGAFTLADNGASTELIQQRGRWSQRGWNEIALMYQRSSETRLQRINEAFRNNGKPYKHLNTRTGSM